MSRLLMIGLILCAPVPAVADRGAGDACAAGLSAASQQIYQRTLANKPTPETARGIVTAQTKQLIAEGQLRVFEARSAAQQAGKCLALIDK